MAVRFAPIQRKILITEPAIGCQFKVVKLTEIVRVQFEQISNDRLLLV